jgi:hypothetical protein
MKLVGNIKLGNFPFIKSRFFSAKYVFCAWNFSIRVKRTFFTFISPFGKINYELWFELVWDISPCRLAVHYRRFEGSQCLQCFGKYFPCPQDISGSKILRLYSLTLKIKTFRLFAPRKLLTIRQVLPSQKTWVSSNIDVGTSHLAKQFTVW